MAVGTFSPWAPIVCTVDISSSTRLSVISGLRVPRDELAATIDEQPAVPDTATFTGLANHINEIITGGTSNQRKALIEALVPQVEIAGPNQLVPVFRIPQP